tara:strand:- start:229 stop:618 length:390 start_codon:yes stop_codon:yes gene_type:complete
VKNKGFTLVELIVVITIIMLVTAVGVISFTGINKRSRDSRRLSDLKKVSIALEIYRQENGSYPDDGDLDDLESDYIDAIPTDPKSFSYYYDQTSDYTYTYDAQMEDVGSTNGSWGANCTGTCNYRVTNP